MNQRTVPQRLLIIDIDGLRQDVFHQALAEQRIPHLAGLLGAGAVHLDPVSTAPSITFCAQSSIFTGASPAEHNIVGNQFFDRFGLRSGGIPRFYAFDVGDALAYHDAVLTFMGSMGLVGQTMGPDSLTLYERAAKKNLTSTVVYHMVSRGASEWIRPSLVDIARFTKGGGLVGMSAEQYDREMMDQTIDIIQSAPMPDLLTVYFMGLDHTSHEHGPGAQLAYLSEVVDAQTGRLVKELEHRGLLEQTLVLVVSDHGHIEVIADDKHSLRLSFPFDREMGYLFDALGLDVHDVPGEGPACEAVVASNGGLAHVYLRRGALSDQRGYWSDIPQFSTDVLPVARAFWDADFTGRYAADLQGALAMVLVRDVERQGWQAEYQALWPDGRLTPVDAFLNAHPEVKTVEAAARLRQLAGTCAGDLLLVSNYRDGYYFAGPTTGVHGGLHPDDSLAVASFGWVGATAEQQSAFAETVEQVVSERRAAEGRKRASIADAAPVLARVMGLEE